MAYLTKRTVLLQPEGYTPHVSMDTWINQRELPRSLLHIDTLYTHKPSLIYNKCMVTFVMEGHKLPVVTHTILISRHMYLHTLMTIKKSNTGDMYGLSESLFAALMSSEQHCTTVSSRVTTDGFWIDGCRLINICHDKFLHVFNHFFLANEH